MRSKIISTQYPHFDFKNNKHNGNVEDSHNCFLMWRISRDRLSSYTQIHVISYSYYCINTVVDSA